MANIQKEVQDSIQKKKDFLKKSISGGFDLIKAQPVGTIKHWPSGTKIMTEKGWRPYKEGGDSKSTKEDPEIAKLTGPEKHARKSSTEELKAFVDRSKKEANLSELRTIAEKELERREDKEKEEENPFAKSEEEKPKKVKLTVDQQWDGYGVYADMVADGDAKSLLAYGAGGVGKFQPLWCKVLTPTGWSTIGEIKIGDIVNTPSGRTSAVLELFPQGEQPIYKITLSDGSVTFAGLEHLWKVFDKNTSYSKTHKKRKRGSYKILTTEDIINKGLLLRKKQEGLNKERAAEWRFMIPFLPTPVEYEKPSTINIDPWLLGLLLGDGCFSQGSIMISTGGRDAEFTLTKIQKALPEGYSINHNTRFDYRLTGLDGKNVIIDSLRELELFGLKSKEKFIPQICFALSSSDRLSIIQGLMDSDGYVSKNGLCVFYSCSMQLAKDFQAIVKSFGRTASFNTVERKVTGLAKKQDVEETSTTYQVTFTLPESMLPCSVPFKLDRYIKANKRFDIIGLSIKNIEFYSYEEAQCIMIDDPEHLYITDDFITTHNTFSIMQVLKKKNMREYDEEKHSKGSHDYDYVKITGKASPTNVYKALYEHNGKLIIFDDCDSALEHDDSLNILKGALDSSGDGSIEWATERRLTDADGLDIPKRFKFKGRVMFISNKPAAEFEGDPHLNAIKTRALTSDLTMTKDETLAKAEKIMPNLVLYDTAGREIEGITMRDKKMLMDFINSHKDDINIANFNMRTFGNAIKTVKKARESDKDWKPLIAPLLGMSSWNESDLKKGLGNEMYSEILDGFLKGKSANIGDIREWSGTTYKKTSNGWDKVGSKDKDSIGHGSRVGIMSSGKEGRKARTGVITKTGDDKHHVLMNDTDEEEEHDKNDLFNNEDE